MQVFFERKVELSPKIWEFYFRPERPVDYIPGQYAMFHLPTVENDPRGKARTFTLTSLPSDPFISFVCRIDDVASQYKQTLMKFQSNDSASIDDTMGDLVLPKSTETPLVFIAGGIGMASFASMLKELAKKREERRIYLFYAVRSAREQIFKELINGYPLQLKTIAIKPNRLSAEEIIDSIPPDSLIYISGSQPFVEGLQTDFEAFGVPRSQIVFDYYDGYAEL